MPREPRQSPSGERTALGSWAKGAVTCVLGASGRRRAGGAGHAAGFASLWSQLPVAPTRARWGEGRGARRQEALPCLVVRCAAVLWFLPLETTMSTRAGVRGWLEHRRRRLAGMWCSCPPPSAPVSGATHHISKGVRPAEGSRCGVHHPAVGLPVADATIVDHLLVSQPVPALKKKEKKKKTKSTTQAGL